MELSPMVLVPAYGRKYKTENHCLEDWYAGKDFKIEGGPYCSIRDFPDSNVYIRFAPGLYLIPAAS